MQADTGGGTDGVSWKPSVGGDALMVRPVCGTSEDGVPWLLTAALGKLEFGTTVKVTWLLGKMAAGLEVERICPGRIEMGTVCTAPAPCSGLCISCTFSCGVCGVPWLLLVTW